MLLASFGQIMGYVGYVLIAILILLLMITVHEAGHYLVGKIFKFGIEEFAIGFGPAIFKKRLKSGELFSLRVFPLGGFCSFKGEDGVSEDPSAFNNKKPWQRILVLISGALMNFLLAILIVFGMFSFYGQTAFKVNKVYYDTEYTAENSLNSGDVILKISNKNVYLITDVMDALDGKKQGDTVEITVERAGAWVTVPVKVRQDVSFHNVEDIAPVYDALGFYSLNADNQKEYSLSSVDLKVNFFERIGRSFEYSFKLAGTVLSVLGQLLTGRLPLSAMGGTVTTIIVTADAIRTGGFWYLLYISSFIGCNLAVFNLLPFPALDGSRVVFCLIEWIFKKPVNRKVEAVIHGVGLVVILLFAIFIDLQRCF